MRLKFLQLLTVTGISLGLFFTPLSLAARETTNVSLELQQRKEDVYGKKEHKEKKFEFRQGNPISSLEKKKEEIQSLVKEGKLTKEKAAEITSRIDARIKSFKEFDKLSLTEKKKKLKENFSSHLEKGVKDGRITKEKMNEVLDEFNKKIDNWDGKGYPKFFFGKGPHKPGLKDNK
jgi:polyhydroxyalkanoate synthesis regulator phasin